MIFLHVLRWPGERLTLPPIPKRIIASCVVTGGKVSVQQTDAGIGVLVPTRDQRELDTIIALKLDGSAADIK